jgi:hypothetical protein
MGIPVFASAKKQLRLDPTYAVFWTSEKQMLTACGCLQG